ncbi:hypothetical protein BRD17_10150 [Halobacteriales archaeon SW_7_68_16]|nr:MAG: hypothetical protein BRD17_10150 [Halobacteriales archaeon SW_7_68_16]
MTVDSATWSTTADWDAAPADLSASVVHEDLVIDTDGDDTSKLSDQVYLGYPTTGRWDRDPVVYYRFDRIISNGGEQEVEDASGNDHDAVARYVDADGAEGTEVGGIAGTGSFAFDGAGDYVFSKDPASYLNGEDAITVSMWVKPLSSASEESLFFETGADDEGDDEPGPISLTRDKKGGGSLRGDLSANKTTKGVSVADGDQRSGRWRHLVIAWSDTDPLELHLNGRQIASSNKEARGVISNVTDFRIGGDDDLFGRDFTGKIDAVRIYDEELTDEEIDDLYNVSNRGVLVTAGKNLSSAVTGDDLQLETAAAVPSGTAVTVYVETDPDGDGVYEGTSSAIRLDDGTNVYDVQDLPTASERFRVRMVLETTDPTKTPIVGGVRLDSS